MRRLNERPGDNYQKRQARQELRMPIFKAIAEKVHRLPTLLDEIEDRDLDMLVEALSISPTELLEQSAAASKKKVDAEAKRKAEEKKRQDRYSSIGLPKAKSKPLAAKLKKSAKLTNKRKRVAAKKPGASYSYEPITPGDQLRHQEKLAAASGASSTGSVNGGSKEKLEAVDKAVLKLGEIRPFVIGDAIRAASVEVGDAHEVTRGVVAASIKRLLKTKQLTKSGAGKNLSYRTKQLELPATTNGAAAHA